MRRARIILLVVGLLLAGAVVNVGVAWACARWGDHWPMGGQTESTPARTLPPTAAEYLSDPLYLRYHAGDGLTVSSTSSWVCTRCEFERGRGPDEVFATSRTHVLIRFGVPFRSMQYTEQGWFNMAAFPESSSWRAPGWRGGWPLAPEPREQNMWGSYRQPAHVYPIAPIPLGFAANTLIYAALLYVLFLAPWALRRWVRRRRGVCVRCAYPVGVSAVCTECGAPILLRS